MIARARRVALTLATAAAHCRTHGGLLRHIGQRRVRPHPDPAVAAGPTQTRQPLRHHLVSREHNLAVQALPTTVIIDRDGGFAGIHYGALPEGFLDGSLESLLKAEPGGKPGNRGFFDSSDV